MIKKELKCFNCNKIFYPKGRNTTGKFCSISCYRVLQKITPNSGTFKKGNKLSKETKEKISLTSKGRIGYFKGKNLAIETRKKMSDSHKKRVDNGLNHLWKGGITKKNMSIRSSMEYKLWREAVYKRDDYTCVWCGIKGGKLNADHIKPFALFPELRLAIDNGRTLCVNCHKTTDTFGYRSNIKKYD